MSDLIKKSAAEHFASNPNVNLFFVTRDGMCFEKWHDANEHSKTLGTEAADREVLEVPRTEVTEVKKTVLELIEAATTVEEVEALIKNNTPKATKQAAALKIEALEAEKDAE